MSLFERLVRYRPSPDRESVENFLTELICEVLSKEPNARDAFLKLGGIAVEDTATWSVRSQVGVPPYGRLDFLLEQRSGGPALIVESKVDDPVDEGQLKRYLACAGEREHTTGYPWRVALVTRGLFSGTIRDPRFAHFQWFRVADALAAIQDRRYPYLVEEVLEFMRELHMGPIERFVQTELGSYRAWKLFERKVDDLLTRLEAQIRDPQPVEHLEWSWMSSSSLFGKGIGWSWPTDIRGVGRRSFWYFLGFLWDSSPWFIRLAADGEPEAVVAIGLWAEAGEVEKLVNKILDESKGRKVSATGFEIVRSDKAQGVVLLRRLPLSEVVRLPDQEASLFGFFKESHRLLVDSGILAAIAAAFRERFPAPSARQFAEDLPERGS
jgi:hypothetical protein